MLTEDEMAAITNVFELPNTENNLLITELLQ